VTASTIPTPRPTIYPILAVNFVGALGFSIVLPFLVFLVTRWGGNAVIYGVMGATYSVFQLIGAPILGRWSDRVGRKKILLLSQIGTLLSWGIFLVALTLPVHILARVNSTVVGAFELTVPLVVLFIARAIDGITGGNVSVANAYLADITSDEDRSANFGLMSMSANFGFIIGPALAAVLGAIVSGELLPVLAAFLISAVATLIITFTLRDPDPCNIKGALESTSVHEVLGGDQKRCYRIESPVQLTTSEILRLPSVGLLLGLQFLVFLAFNFYYIAFPVYAATTLGWSLGQVGLYFAVMAVLMATVQGPVLSRAGRRFGDERLVIVGSLLLAMSFVFFISNNMAVIYGGTVLLALGNGLMWPSLLAVLSKTTDQQTQGAVQGLADSINAIASIVGLLVGGLLFGVIGGAVFLLSAAMTTLVFLLALGWERRSQGLPSRQSVESRS
jgi:DHA1 family tetracycline resistance protein-like MFS transporter